MEKLRDKHRTHRVNGVRVQDQRCRRCGQTSQAADWTRHKNGAIHLCLKCVRCQRLFGSPIPKYWAQSFGVTETEAHAAARLTVMQTWNLFD